MDFTQFELPIVFAPQKPIPPRKLRSPQSQAAVKQSIYQTTKQIIELFESGGSYSVRKKGSHIYRYENDRYIADFAGRNKWNLYESGTS